MPTSGPVDLRDEPAGLQDRLTGVEKLSAAREALRGAGDRASAKVRDAMVHAPEQISALDHGVNFMSGGWSEERADFTVGAARAMLDMGAQAAMPVSAPLMMSPVNQALDDLEGAGTSVPAAASAKPAPSSSPPSPAAEPGESPRASKPGRPGSLPRSSCPRESTPSPSSSSAGWFQLRMDFRCSEPQPRVSAPDD